MTNITKLFNQEILPETVIVLYGKPDRDRTDKYVELMQVNEDAELVNAHPLTLSESVELAKCFSSLKPLANNFGNCNGVFPATVLKIDTRPAGNVTWYTKPKSVFMHFQQSSDIPSGKAKIPALVWKANQRKLSVFALKDGKRPKENTELYHAPFFNVYSSGEVCMGTTSLKTLAKKTLLPFMQEWERLFFDSVFSHALNNYTDDKSGQCVWKSLVNSKEKFPVDMLKKNHLTIKNIL
ncbi:prokaryotic E2 ligase family D protein [Chitinophaga rhizophila]|uniref:Prokaryotic E2 ligase family D protein n=1 Tax=Chitinophaga rhizophila TaxID=2866212 RepID=A0ABS7G7Y8_9BACT|nr:prokaryotic E2 ligase family D protein [Chitinophaga rhizophila]MBW8683506.1 prokaryotic E2 ligase family D protein [Chitinophaga rhizophila]